MSMKTNEAKGRRDPTTTTFGVDDQIIVELWHAHRRWVAAVVYAHKPRDVDVEDIMQEVAVKLVQNYHKLNDTDSIRPWLRTVAVNAARSAGRKIKSRNKWLRTVDVEQVERISGQPLAIPTDPPKSEQSCERGRRALELAGSLPPHYREPLLLNLRGLTQKQIADVLDVPVTTIETRLIRARRMLRDELVAEETNSTSSFKGISGGISGEFCTKGELPHEYIEQ